MNAIEIRDRAANLVQEHASRLGMDAFAAELLVSAIRKLPADGSEAEGSASFRASDHLKGR